MGDLHQDNFGTWRDSEGRLLWGINDVDEAWPLPYTQDLVRLVSSLVVPGRGHAPAAAEAADAVLAGYAEALAHGGCPFVLAEHHKTLRSLALDSAEDPDEFWKELTESSPPDWRVPESLELALAGTLPAPGLNSRLVARRSGLGSLGRRRVVALADWNGGLVAREAKERAPSAAARHRADPPLLGGTLLAAAVRQPDPMVRLTERWQFRRLAPDCVRLDLDGLEEAADAAKVFWAMGYETGNMHLGSREAVPAVLDDLNRRPPGWLAEAAERMAKQVTHDWGDWCAFRRQGVQ